MPDLPDDLWSKILDLGINNNKLTYKDLCSISITCKRLDRLSVEDSLWSHLLSSDFPRRITFSSFIWPHFWIDPLFSVSLQKIANQPSSSSAKSQYRIRLEINRERERQLEERRRAARLEQRRRIAELWRRLFEFRVRRVQRRAVLEQENIVDILWDKIEELELAKQKKKKKVTAADLFNSTKPQANCKGFERVPDRRYPREWRHKAFTQQTKSWHR